MQICLISQRRFVTEMLVWFWTLSFMLCIPRITIFVELSVNFWLTRLWLGLFPEIDGSACPRLKIRP